MDTQQARSNEEYPGSPANMPTPFLSPPMSWENRRGSAASSQSSYCQSFASSDYCSLGADYSVPVTPIFASSPGAQEPFADVMPYEINPEYQSPVVHGLSSHVPHQKEFGDAEPMCESFVMIQQRQGIQSIPFRAQGFHLPGSLDTTIPHSGPEIVMDVTDTAATTEPSWSSLNPFVWSDTRDYHFQVADCQSPVYGQMKNRQAGGLPLGWENSTHVFDHSRAVSAGTIMPSVAITDDFSMMTPDSLEESHIIGEQDSTFPQTPQEVSFKREETPLIKDEDIKDEPESDSGSRRFGDRVYHRRTGAKGVKREPRSETNSPRQARRSKKSSKAAVQAMNYRVSKVSDACYDFRDYQAKKREDGKWFRTDGCTERKQQCDQILPDGTRCTKSFKRQEHMKRHHRTHLMKNEAWCKICKKGFNRNDNCIAHYETHLAKPGGKPGRNRKMTLREMEEKMMDERADMKMIEKIREKCRAKHPEAAIDYDLIRCKL